MISPRNKYVVCKSCAKICITHKNVKTILEKLNQSHLAFLYKHLFFWDISLLFLSIPILLLFQLFLSYC